MLKISGYNVNYLFGEESNNKTKYTSFISPPIYSHVDVSTISSYSLFYHTIMILKNGEILFVGNNNQNIIKSLPREVTKSFTRFDIMNEDNKTLNPISSCCGENYILYMLSATQNSDKKQLAYSHYYFDSQYPLFLNIGESNPVALFNGESNAAVIDSEGSVIFISESVCDFPKEQLEATKLPNKEKAVSVACCQYFVVVAGSKGNVFISDVNFNESKTSLQPKRGPKRSQKEVEVEVKPKLIKLIFKQVDTLKNIKIVNVSGFSDHCFAVSEDGRVFGFGDNKYGRLCLGEKIKSVDKFTEISLLNKYKIKGAYAGFDHSLFQTIDGKILACGCNEYGQLLVNEGIGENVYKPVDTGISGATFCIAGLRNSAVFINYDPLMCPNRRINDQKESSKQETFPLRKKSSEEEIFIDTEEENQFFTNLGKIGEGATSITYKVIDNRTKIPICKKVLKYNNGNIKDAKRSMNEFKVMHDVNHPCICQAIRINFMEPIEVLTKVGKKEEVTTIALFLEFVEHKLADVLKSDLITNTFKTKIVIDIAHAMNYLHKHGMMHRDLKIDNIMINSLFETKIVDFGLVRITETAFDDFSFVNDSLSRGIGTFAYMSPEMSNEEDYDNKTDVYSFGIVLHFIFIGTLPKQNLRDKLNGKKIDLPSPSNSMSSFCRNLITQCLSFSPENRPSFEEILNQMRENSYELAANVDPSVLEIHDKELSFIENNLINK